MPQPVVCPELIQYQQLAAGALAGADEDTLLEHLERCDPCARKLHTLAEPDMLVELIRKARARSDRADDKVLGRQVERLSKLCPVADAAAEKTVPPREAAPLLQLAFACPSCGKRLKVKSDLAGKTGKCPHCKQAVQVPAASAAAREQAALGTMMAEPRSLSEAQTVGGGKATSRLIDPAPGPLQSAGAAGKELYDFLAPAQAPDELGRLGPYRVLQVLGAGGMGVVFRAEDPQLARLVALKAMLPTLAASESARQRFLREARAAAAIKHDHIVTIYQVGEDRGVPFLAMEFLDGEPLDVRLEREGKLPLVEVLRIGREIALGLSAAHKRELIHRDIKPANIWLEAETRRAKILDFGLARAVGQENQLTQQGAIVGTPAYMAPEQAQGQSVDARCDLFSLGCVLYRLATGTAAFRGTDMVSTLLAVATEKPRPPDEVEPSLPPALSELILSLLAKEPGKRPSSARAVVEALERIARNRKSSPPTTRAKAPSPQAKPGRRRWGMLAAIGGAVVVLVLLATVLFRMKVKTPEGNAFVVLEIDQPGAEVVVDGQKIIVTVPGDNKPVEIQVAPGQHKLQISKDGFVMASRDVELKTGKSDAIRVRLEPVPKPAQKEVPADALRREEIPEAVLATLGGGDSKLAPPELAAVLGDGRFRLAEISFFPAFSPDGALLAVPSGGEALLFDANSGQLLRRFRGRSGRVVTVAFSPNGAMLAVADEAMVRLWNPRVGVLLQELSGHAGGTVHRLAFTPDNQTVLFDSVDNTVCVCDVTTGRQTRVLSCKGGGRFPRHVRSIAITPDGRLAVAGTFDGHVHGWSLDTGAEKFVLAPKQEAWAWVSISADGQWLASGTNYKVKVWKITDLANKDPTPFFEKQTPAGWLQFEKNSNKLWTAEVTDHRTDRACCWNPASGQLVSSVTLQSTQSPWFFCAISPDGRTLAAVAQDERMVHLYDTRTGKPRFPDPGHTREVYSVVFSPDGRWLASGSLDNTVRVWDLATGTTRHKLVGHTAAVWSVAFSPDSKLLASGSHDGTMALWDPVTGARVRTLDGSFPGASVQSSYFPESSLRFSPNGKVVAAGTADGGVRMWSAQNGEEIRVLRGLHEGRVKCQAFSADGQFLATGGEDGKLVITDLVSGKLLQSSKRKTAVFTVEFGADGETVAAGYDPPESVVRVWNLKTKDFVSDFVSLTGHTDRVSTVALRSDGRLALTTSTDGSVRLWEIGRTTPRKMVLGLGSVGERLWTGSLSPDGRYVATGNSNGTIYVFRLPRPAENIGEWLAGRGSPPPGLSEEAWLERVKGLYVGRVPDAVSDRLRELNPGFDGQVRYQVEGTQVVRVDFGTNSVKEISPLRALPGLRGLGCPGNWWSRNGQVADLTPLKGMKLTNLYCQDTQVADLSPLQGMPLTSLNCGLTKVSDLSPLKGMPLTDLTIFVTPVSDLSPLQGMKLEKLNCYATQVADLSPLKGMKLTFLYCHGSKVTDLSPLKDMPLTEIACDFNPDRDTTILRSFKTLKRINEKPAEEFWKEVDAKQRDKKP
jgi:WD40 repeat protein